MRSRLEIAAPGSREPKDAARVGGLASRSLGRQSGFTMIEIAISLGVIGFALVAIIGIMPFAMTVPRENREQTIINHDANMLLNAIRNGAQGLDDLTNYVVGITNYRAFYPTGHAVPSVVDAYGFSYTNSDHHMYGLTNGFIIVGLLSMPKYQPVADPAHPPTATTPGQYLGFFSNHVVAIMRSMSGIASDKPPQSNLDVQNTAFTYRLISEVIPYGFAPANAQGVSSIGSGWSTDWTNYLNPSYTNSVMAWLPRSNYWRYAQNLQPDLNEIRLLFRWPALPRGNAGNGRQVFRAMAAGPIKPYALPGFPLVANEPYEPEAVTLHFVQPATFVNTP